jgi:hypothetical protein
MGNFLGFRFRWNSFAAPAAEDDMKTTMWLILGLISVAVPSASDAQWVKSGSKDAFTDKQFQTFVLEGKFVDPPAKPVHAHPYVSISCSGGKFAGAILSPGAQLKSESGVVNARVDDGKTFRWIGAVSEDFSKVIFPFKTDLKRILTGRKVLLGAFEYPAGSILMEFDIPDSSEVFAACGKL